MTEFIYYTSSSLNGYIADERNSLEWLFAVDASAGSPDTSGFIESVGVQVMGTTTYEWLLRTEGLLEVPQKWQRFFGSLNTCVLTSRTLPRPEGANITFIAGPVNQHIAEIEALAGERNVWVVGGGDVAAQFLDAGRLDRIEITFAPVALADGAPVLPRFVPAGRLQLEAVHQEGPFARLVYRVVSAGSPPSVG